jgi:hypothetical protein
MGDYRMKKKVELSKAITKPNEKHPGIRFKDRKSEPKKVPPYKITKRKVTLAKTS